MDRGRCGYDLVGNKFLREKALSHKRSVHKERLDKIKNRQPGTSSTLDNTIPESLLNNKFAKNPRKWKKKTERNLTIQRENKVLLQRISHILTAPPHINDSDYQNMQKLIQSIDYVEEWNRKLTNKKNKLFFERIKNIGPYYHPEKWESDYQKQLEGQKFMRQVTYQRPKDWIDPFHKTDPTPTTNSSFAPSPTFTTSTTTRKIPPRPSTVCTSSPSKQHHRGVGVGSGSERSSSRSHSTHVGRIKALKQSNSVSSALSILGPGSEENEQNLEEQLTTTDSNNHFYDFNNDHDELGDIYEEDEFDDGSVEHDRILAKCERKIFINVLDDPVITPSRPVMRRDSSIRTMIVQPSQPPSSLMQQSQQQSTDTTTPTTPPQPLPEHRRTLGSGASRRNLFAEMHQSQQSFRSLHHTNSNPQIPISGSNTTPPINVTQLKQSSNAIRYEINVQITCILTELNQLHLEVTGIEDATVHTELNFYPNDLTGRIQRSSSSPTSTHEENKIPSNPTPHVLTTLPTPSHDHIPYNWSFPIDRTLQNNLGSDIVHGIQLCVRGGQEYSIVLPDPSLLHFEIDPQIENEVNENECPYTDEDALRILEDYEPMSISAAAMIPIEVFYPIVTSPVRQVGGLTRQKNRLE